MTKPFKYVLTTSKVSDIIFDLKHIFNSKQQAH